MSLQQPQTQTVTKYLGVAGGGKTYQIKQEIGDALATGVSASDIVVLAFNRAKKESLADELATEFRSGDDIRVSTVHSKALQLCIDAGHVDLSDERIIVMDNKSDEEYFARFFADYWDGRHVEFSYQPDISDGDAEFAEAATGNKVLDAGNYCKAMAWEYDLVHETPHFSHIPLARETVIEILHTWEDYKEQFVDKSDGIDGLLQHSDYLKICHEEGLSLSSDTKMLVLDEMQDYNPRMYGLYKNWRDGDQYVTPPRRIVLAGDPAQSIYSFRGATPYYLQETDADETEYLTTTRRCASAIIDVAAGLLNPLDHPNQKYDASPIRDGETIDVEGTVTSHHPHSEAHLAKLVEMGIEEYVNDDSDEIFILTRTNSDVRRIEAILREAGIPYGGLGKRETEWDSDLAAIYTILSEYDQRKSVPPHIVGILLRNATEEDCRQQAVVDARKRNLGHQLAKEDPWGHYPDTYLDDGDLSPAVLKDWFSGAESAVEIVPELDLNDHEREVLRVALARDPSLEMIDEPSVKVGTIHSAKGEEAEATFLLTDYSETQYERYQNGAEDEERRLYYVGCTRGRNGLHIIHNLLDHRNHEFPPLKY